MIYAVKTLGILLFAASFILTLKTVFVNLLSSGKVKKLGIRYFIFNLCGFYIQSSFGSQITNDSYFNFSLNRFDIQKSLCSQINKITNFVFNLSLEFLFSMVVVSNPVTVDILFSISVVFVLQSVVLISPLVLGIFLPKSSFFLLTPCFSKSYCVLITNSLAHGILAWIV